MSDFTKLSDQELLVLLKRDELSAFKELYRRYWKNMFGEAFKHLKSKELAEEITQEIFTNFLVKTAIAAG